jgi:ATP synthase protein I
MSAKRPRPPDPLHSEVERFAARRRRWAEERGRTFVAALAVIGIGWAIVVPAVLGFAIGHWLDARMRSGVVFAAGLGLLGTAVGCYSAYRQIKSRD